MEALKHFESLIKDELARVERMKKSEAVDFKTLSKIKIGVVDGDGIGPIITGATQRVLEHLLKKEIKAKKVEIVAIDGLTLENRIKAMKAIPDDLLAKIKDCHVILKGPTATPDSLSGMPNLESANVRMRKELDLFANVRPVAIPELGIDWCFFRENTEGAYAAGSRGINVTDDLAIDFTITTRQGTERIARAAFDYAVANNKTKIAVVTKANAVKTTDGNFLKICSEVAEKEYPGLVVESWYADIISANLINESRRASYEVFVCPNLYGDILTDEAAQIQGGVGTAAGANIGSRYAMFEAIHGSAPRMVAEGRAMWSDPRGIMRAGAMMLSHIGYTNYADKLQFALLTLPCGMYNKTETCDEYTKKLVDYLSKP